jgi:hypothetical protein
MKMATKMHKYFIDYIVTDLISGDSYTDDCHVMASSPEEAIQKLESIVSDEQHIVIIEYIGVVVGYDVAEIRLKI